jgi:hypothetical protein
VNKDVAKAEQKEMKVDAKADEENPRPSPMPTKERRRPQGRESHAKPTRKVPRPIRKTKPRHAAKAEEKSVAEAKSREKEP